MASGQFELNKFYKARRINPVKDDWTTQIEKDKLELNINLDDEDIKGMSKYKFKKFLKGKIKTATLAYLNQLKKKKSKFLQSKEIKCSNYLINKLFTKNEAQLLFKFRTHMYSVKENFSKQYENNMNCELCASAVSSQQHLFLCPVLIKFIPEIITSGVKYDYLFENSAKMKEIVPILQKICDVREQLLDDIKTI